MMSGDVGPPLEKVRNLQKRVSTQHSCLIHDDDDDNDDNDYDDDDNDDNDDDNDDDEDDGDDGHRHELDMSAVYSPVFEILQGPPIQKNRGGRLSAHDLNNMKSLTVWRCGNLYT
jgi:ABC-type Zn2+ transport system substrate-binding protein/surface adhesin